MSEDDLSVLRILGSDFRDFSVRDLTSVMSKSPQQVLSHFDRLQKLGYVHRSVLDLAGNNDAYAITAEGRAALVKRKLL
ncbi:MAG TPA: hypothetical protein VLC46_27975 [Thermoanaerobaculia bacterium]|nr:hypothetical protein [Thermoanaerobaculia bacterium]